MLERAKTSFEKAGVLLMQCVQYNTIGKMEASIQVGIQGAALLGVKISATPTRMSLLKEFLPTHFALRRRTITDLLDMPALIDPAKEMIMNF